MRKQECDQTIAEFEDTLRRKPRHPHREIMLDEIEREKKIRSIISRAVPD